MDFRHTISASLQLKLKLKVIKIVFKTDRTKAGVFISDQNGIAGVLASEGW